MYNETYDDYIRSILGYPNQSNLSVNNYNSGYNMATSRQNNNNTELESCYPEIYKIVYPMVAKACDSNTRPVTRELIENMTDEIYFAIEGNDEVNININLTNEIKNNTVTNNTNREENRADVKIKESKENRETRQINRGLRDLIKILLLRELLGRPGFPGGNRPPVRPPRPPFPGGPGPRPHMRPRNLDYDIYEY